MKFSLAAIVTLILLTGCATIPENTETISGSIVPIDASRLVLEKNLTFLPSLSGYYFPAGIYVPVEKDSRGVFYQSPKGIKGIGLGNMYYSAGGIYRFIRDEGSYGLKSWTGKPKISIMSRDLYDMIGANFSENLYVIEDISKVEPVGGADAVR